jgi:RNA polymerase sigma-70 factor (ECF subfamily)
METITMPTEAHIRHALVANFDNGFTELVSEYQPGIYSGARRLTRHTHDAQDIAQDTFVRAYSALSGYEPERILDLKVRAYLWTIALNLCRNRATRRVPEVPIRERETAVEDVTTSIDEVAWSRRLANLNSHQREAVVMRHVLDMPITEISEATGRPSGTVKADISRGLERLRTTIEAEAHHDRS